uniref:C-type lectin domain-containing protein n=1 Tax=Malurus cyaneus samueli TaxID=2593467 RepID=A0A8C5UG64_9PASS
SVSVLPSPFPTSSSPTSFSSQNAPSCSLEQEEFRGWDSNKTHKLNLFKIQAFGGKIPILFRIMSHLGMLCLFSSKKCPPCTAPTLPRCLDSGISFGNKLFYFLEEEVDWEGSQHSCLSHQAHLATIDTREELHFLLHYGNFKEYWVGLQREGSRPWKWLNDSLFSALISSDRCSETKFSICSHLQRHPSEVQKDTEILNST